MKKISILLLMLTLIFIAGCNCGKNDNGKIEGSLFETGYSNVTINKDTLKASSGTIYGFYKDSSFTTPIDPTKESADKIYVKLLVGSGSETDPYLIESSNSLNSLTHFGSEINGFVKVTSDFSAESIYTQDYEKTIFNGTFDGNNHKISFIEDTSKVNTGLFYKVGAIGTISNLNIYGPVEATQASTGALCNYNEGLINNVRTYGTSFHASNGANNGVSLMTKWDDENENVLVDHGTVGKLSTLDKGGAGGIAGTNNGKITNCVNAMNVRATIGAGGIAGINNGEISDCFNNGAIGTTGNNAVNSTTIRDHQFDFSYIGGMAGANYGLITRCVNSNQIFVARLPWKFNDAPAGQSDYIDRIRVGGIAGANFGTFDTETSAYTKGIITECANYGRVHGDMQVGGIAGYTSGYIADCEVISPIGARSCLGGIAGWMSGDKIGDKIPIVTNCIAITRVAAGTNQSVVDELGNQYTAVKLLQLSSSVSETNIDEYYHIAKYATNCIYHNYGGKHKPLDPETGLADSVSTSTTATMSDKVYSVVAYKDGENSNLWVDFMDSPQSNPSVTAIVGFNTSWQAFINEYLRFQDKTITYVINGTSKSIKAVAGVNYLTNRASKSGDTWVSGLASNYSVAINEKIFPLEPLSVGTGQEVIWVTEENNANSRWDGYVTSDITIYAMVVEKG